MNFHAIVHEEVRRRILLSLPVPDPLSLPLDDKLRTQSLKRIVVCLVVQLVRCDLSNGEKGTPHRMLAEGSRLAGMTGAARGIADVADVGMNVSVRTLVDKAWVYAGRFGGSAEGHDLRSGVVPNSVEQSHKG